MSKVSKPTTPCIVFDPTTGKASEAPTTDIEEMERRAKQEAKEKEKAKAKKNDK